MTEENKVLSIFSDKESSLAEMFNKDTLPSTPSFGGLTLAENANRAEKALAKMSKTERVWNRRKSEWVWKHGNMKHYDDFGNMKQLSAEMASRRMALQEAKWNFLKTEAKIEIQKEKLEKEESPAKQKLLRIKIAQLEEGMSTGMKHIEGALKDVLVLESLYDQLLENMGEFNEEDFEKNEPKFHLSLALQQALRDVRETGRIFKGNAEYLEWCGVNISKVEQQLQKAVEHERRMDSYDGSYIRDFIRELTDELVPFVMKRAQIMGFVPEFRDDNLYLPKIKKEEEDV